MTSNISCENIRQFSVFAVDVRICSHSSYLLSFIDIIYSPKINSGVAGPLAARGGGQICRPFILGFGNWRAYLKYKSHVMSTVTLVY